MLPQRVVPLVIFLSTLNMIMLLQQAQAQGLDREGLANLGSFFLLMLGAFAAYLYWDAAKAKIPSNA